MMNEKAKLALVEYRTKIAAGEIERSERLDPMQKAKANPASKTFAIRAMCWDCVGGDGTPNWTQEVKLCPVAKCALHHVRPYK